MNMPRKKAEIKAETLVFVKFLNEDVRKGNVVVRERTRKLSVLQHAQKGRKPSLQIPSVDDEIEEAVLQNELRALETLGQILSDRFANNTGAGKSDE
jgi:hypothetical protein